MSCNLQCGCIIPVGSVGRVQRIPDEVMNIINTIHNRGGNINAQAIFTFYWGSYTDLDMWVKHKESGEFVSYTKTHNSKLDMTLDVDANASNSVHTRTPIENIGMLKSSGLDGTYEVYLNMFNQRDTGNNFFNFITAYKTDNSPQFNKIVWYRNTSSYDAPNNQNNDYSKMIHVIDLVKQGGEFRIGWKTDTLKLVYQWNYAGARND